MYLYQYVRIAVGGLVSLHALVRHPLMGDRFDWAHDQIQSINDHLSCSFSIHQCKPTFERLRHSKNHDI